MYSSPLRSIIRTQLSPETVCLLIVGSDSSDQWKSSVDVKHWILERPTIYPPALDRHSEHQLKYNNPEY